jgi:ubiquinone/menaquinone biosynthesis C-methylase UbiE
MTKVNYDEISKVYDDVRQADVELIQVFLSEVDLNPSSRILDIGAGTGNHADALQRITHAQVCGVEPSEGMIQKALDKNPTLIFKLGDAAHIPFDDQVFDFAYMTDVIHHVPDLTAMFAEIRRVLKPGAKGCIVTQSHDQIGRRPIARFFPGTADVDKARYPEIDEIIRTAEAQTFASLNTTSFYENEPVEIGESFLELVRKKGYSMLHLISGDEYEAGLHQLEAQLETGPFMAHTAGETLVWLVRQ